jgi:Ca-activated chloride channel family protein
MAATRHEMGEGAMSFARPDLLWLAVLLPALAAAGVLGYFRRRRGAARILGEVGLISRLGGAGLDRFPTRRFLFIVPAALLIGLAAAGPRWGSQFVETQGRMLKLVLALDVSKSMYAQDLAPNRLERQRLFATRPLRELDGDRIGLVVFAGRAYTLAPLTTDLSALHLYIDALDPQIVSHGGSSLASAITQAVDLVRGEGEIHRDRAVVVVSDGEAHEDESAVNAAVNRAKNHGVILHTVGVGTRGGAPVPDHDELGRIRGYKRDPDTGEIVVSRLDERLLEESARATGGLYTPIDRAGATDRLLAEIRGLERESEAGGRREVPRERFGWFIALALILLALDTALSHRGHGTHSRCGLAPESGRTTKPGPGAGAQFSSARGTMRASRAIPIVALLILVNLAFGIGDLERGNRLYRQGRYAEAVEAYQAALAKGDPSPTLHYNLGTALLRLGRRREAEEHLRAALASVDPEARERTLYNLGNRYLEEGSEATDENARTPLLDAAADAYRDALRLDPTDSDAKWNLELTLREKDNPPLSSGSSQQNQDDDQNDGGEPEPDDQGGMTPPPGSPEAPSSEARDSGKMTPEEAERLLSAIEQAERDLQRSKLRKGQRETPVARDW